MDPTLVLAPLVNALWWLIPLALLGTLLKPGAATNRAHVRSLETRADPLAQRRCPKCGSALILRTVKKGPRAGDRFWGCSTYPRCRVMQPLG